MSRAERFEDEKRRIIDSCFSKLDQSNQLIESYITHIRVLEDALYPSTPSPPESAPENKKPRLIIIAVRSTGRVRMHKARENNNGSFSIGKTWNLEDLSAIESFDDASSPPQSDVQAKYISWAGSVGFVVTITKPYYWQAGTAKEKEFFIASAVKIYRKYTKGQVPELRGFDDAQKTSMLGSLPGQHQASPPPPPPPVHAPRQQNESPSPAPAPPHPPFAQKSSRDTSRYRESPGPPGSTSDLDLRSPSATGSRTESPAPFAPPPPIGAPKPFASTDNLRSQSPLSSRAEQRPSTSGSAGGLRSPGPPLSQMPRAPSQQSSQSQLRSESPASMSMSNGRDGPFRPPAPPFASQSRSRNPSGQSIDTISQVRQNQPAPAANGNITQPSAQATQPRGRDESPALPPIATMPAFSPFTQSKSNENPPAQPSSGGPKTGESDISSPGIGDPSAFASVAGFMGPDHSTSAAEMPANEPVEPPAPPRSKRRPTLESAMSDPTLETLRPAPLNPQSNQRSVTATPELQSSYATPREVPTPDGVDSPAMPLGQARNNSDSNLPLPGVGHRSALAPSPLSTPAPTPGEELTEEAAKREQEEEFRPGLGPMIRKKAVADRMKKAALAANAFKPRPGGAAEKILQAKAEREAKGEPDGITSVVPRPVKQEMKQEEPAAKEPDDLAVKAPSAISPQVEVSAASPTEQSLGGMDGTRGIELHDQAPPSQVADEENQEIRPETDEKQKVEQRQLRQPQVKIKRRSATHERYLDALGVDRSLLANRCLDFEMMLHDFGWNDASLSPKALANMEADLRREQNRLDTASWLASPSQEANARQERENQVTSLLDKAIHECDEMDGLLTIYNVELSSLNDDIAYVEAQSQGLQVQAANQRNLHTELTNLVQTLALDRRALEPIKSGDLSTSRGIDEVEQSLKKVYQAIITIDPTVRSNPSGRPHSRNGPVEGNELSSMAAVRQKQDAYLQESEMFCQRLLQHLDFTFTTTFNSVKNQTMTPASGAAGGTRLNPDAFAQARKEVWVYSPLILFSKELNRTAWQNMIKTYNVRAKPIYADAFGQNVAGWKRVVRKSTGEESEILFTAQEKEEAPTSGSMVSSARKLTVKRSQTLAKTLRKASDERPSTADARNSGGMHHCEVFSAALDEMAPLVSQEQNFVVDLFHATSLENVDFIDVLNTTPPDQRLGTNVVERKPMEPDREMARQVTSVMDDIFGFFTNELSKLLDWSLSVDPIQGVGVMACLSRHSFYLQDSSQEILIQLIDTLMARLQNMFSKFVDEQIRAIEDTKVKIKKRKGVIGFMRIFPHFAVAVENTFAAVGRTDYEQEADCMHEVRTRVDEAYTRINRAMFDSLKIIAKETPLAAAPTSVKAGTDDPEDKEKLNYNVLIIENMNHYIEEVDDGGKRGVLADWKGRAEMERAEAMDSYVGQVIRRPLGKLLVSLLLSTST